MARHSAKSRWPAISREVAIPAWARKRAKHNQERLAALTQPGTKVRVDMRATIDWRSLCRFDEQHVDIKIDWTLIEFVGLAGMLASGGLAKVDVAGTFDDVLLSAEFNKYEAAETILIGELQRLLCWRSIQHDNLHAAMFFYRRFMDYCAANQRAIKTYLKTLRRGETAGIGTFDFLVGHEFGHFCFAHPDRLSGLAELYVPPRTFGPNSEDPQLLEAISNNQLSFDHYLELVSNEAHVGLVEELRCDCVGLWFTIKGDDGLKADRVGHMLDYARVVHLIGLMSYLEATLFDDGAEDGLGAIWGITLLHSVRAYYLVRYNLLSVGMMTMFTEPGKMQQMVELKESIEQFIRWLDRATGLFIEKVVFWRFDLKDLGPESFWLSPQQEVVIDHLRRYPNFTKEDYATADRIAAALPRGWIVSED